MNQSILKSKQKHQWYNEKFLGNVIMQEDKVRQFPTEEGIMELIQNYSKLVEYYGSKNDLISTYFTQKMHRLMQSQATLDAFQNNTENKQKPIQRPPLQNRMSFRSTKRKKNVEELMEITYGQFQTMNGLIGKQLNVQRIDLEQRLKTVKFRQQDNLSRMLRSMHRQSNGVLK